jgi:hypothetical protein
VLPILVRSLHNRMAGLAQRDCDVEQAFNVLDQTVGVYRLHHDVVEARLTRQGELARMRISRRGNERNVLRSWITSESSRRLEARDAGQFEIEDDQVRQ